MEFRKDIQILRALAVIFVVLFHLEVGGLASGFLGVDVFFVVSGFLMALLYKKGEAKRFFERRARRLLPAYFATVIITLFASLWIVLPSELGQVATQSIYSLFFANNIGFWMQNSYFSKADFNPLLHLWSLGVEIQFYLIVPILAWFLRKSKIFLPIFLLGSFAACIFMVGISPKTSFFMMPLRMWEFLIGFVVAYYFTINGGIKYNNFSFLGLFGLLCLVSIPFIKVDGDTLSRLSGHPGFFALFVCIATVLVLIFGLPKFINQSKIGDVFSIIGNYSYSIYLVHFPIIVLYLYEPFSGTKLYPHENIDKFILLVLIIISSILMHKFVENRKFNSNAKVYFYSFFSIITLVVSSKFIPSILYNQKNINIFNGLGDRAPYRCGKIVRILNPVAISCKINSENFNKSLLLVGNSHADSIKIAFQEVSSKHGFNTYFLVSNTPLMDNSVTPEMLINEAKQLKVEKLVLHYSPDSIKIDILEKIIKLALEKNLKVDFILPVPVYLETIPKSLYFQNNKLLYSKEKYFENNKMFLNAVSILEQKHDNLRVYPVVQELCAAVCQIADDFYHPYYFDSNHLTLTGAKKLTPVFERIF